MASGCKYILTLFKKYPVAELPRIKAPLGYHKHDEGSDDQISRILKYLYGNQDIYKIKAEVTD